MITLKPHNPFGFRRSAQQRHFTHAAVYHQQFHFIVDATSIEVTSTCVRVPYCYYSPDRRKWYEDHCTITDMTFARSLLLFSIRLSPSHDDKVALMRHYLHVAQLSPSQALTMCCEATTPIILSLLAT